MPQTRTLTAPTGFIPSASKHIRSGMGILLEMPGLFSEQPELRGGS
ncbi:hypothetical protein HMPREF9004_0052 [Schaalia cardiffensis F0333]|uniref:Uncharacterized protein n=1 Tax=Schaalia cardiffensis F0333 TaxID=888050 RepID=N6XD31_9ACTO|nr:hypothetical protein HMPREF9004_0052 [Schaalia cardiffensis F0333]